MFLIFDYLGTFIFALTGGLKAIKNKLDILGLFVLSLLTGIGGGIIRDLILGQTPPAAFKNELYFLMCILGAIISIFIRDNIKPIRIILPVFDAFGLGIFAASGAMKAINFGLGPIGVGIAAVLTATGGGMIRDICVKEIPAIIRTDIYASAALLGSLTAVILTRFDFSSLTIMLTCFIVTTLLRLFALYFKLELPRFK